MRQHLSASRAAQQDSLAMPGMHTLISCSFFFFKVVVTVVLLARNPSRESVFLLIGNVLCSVHMYRGQSPQSTHSRGRRVNPPPTH